MVVTTELAASCPAGSMPENLIDVDGVVGRARHRADHLRRMRPAARLLPAGRHAAVRLRPVDRHRRASTSTSWLFIAHRLGGRVRRQHGRLRHRLQGRTAGLRPAERQVPQARIHREVGGVLRQVRQDHRRAGPVRAGRPDGRHGDGRRVEDEPRGSTPCTRRSAACSGSPASPSAGYFLGQIEFIADNVDLHRGRRRGRSWCWSARSRPSPTGAQPPAGRRAVRGRRRRRRRRAGQPSNSAPASGRPCGPVRPGCTRIRAATLRSRQRWSTPRRSRP